MLAQHWVSITLGLGLLVTATFIGMGLVVRQWRRSGLVKLGQVWLRLAGGLVIQTLWVLIGVMLLNPALKADPHLAMQCFFAALAVACLLPVMAVADVWLTVRSQAREEARLAGEFAAMVEGLQKTG